MRRIMGQARRPLPPRMMTNSGLAHHHFVFSFRFEYSGGLRARYFVFFEYFVGGLCARL